MIRGSLLHPTATRRWFEEERATIRSEHTRRNWFYSMKALQEAHPDKRVNEFTEDDLVAWLSQPHLAPNTVYSRRTCLVSFFGWAHYAGLIETNPAANLKRRVRVKPQNRRKGNWLGESQVAFLAKVCEGEDPCSVRDRIIILTLVFTGLRRVELSELQWGNIDLEQGHIWLMGKGEKSAYIGLAPRLQEALELWRRLYEQGLGRKIQPTDPLVCPLKTCKGKPFGSQAQEIAWGRRAKRDTIYWAVKRRGQMMGLPSLATHDLRRTFAGLLEEQVGKDLKKLQAAMRHSSVGTTERYLEKNPRRAVDTMRAFDIDLGG